MKYNMIIGTYMLINMKIIQMDIFIWYIDL